MPPPSRAMRRGEQQCSATWTRWGAAAAVMSIVGMLSGCDAGMFRGPLAIRGTEEAIEVAICEPIAIVGIEGLVRPPIALRRWATFWTEAGPSTELTAGAVLRPGFAGGESVRYEAPDLSEGTEVDLALADATGGTLSAVFTIPSDGLRGTSWLRPDGSIAASPCLLE
jgi:hypothetical protein